MSVDIEEKDHTGKMIETPDSVVGLKVVEKMGDTGIYLMENYIKGYEGSPTGAYFVTDAQLEVMIIGYETGHWIPNGLED